MKKKILALAMVAMSLSILAYESLAYFTAEDTAHNVITTNGVDIAIEEWQESASGLVPYPKEPIQVMPGITVSKIVTVKNFEADAYIRAKFDVIVKDDENRVMEQDESTLESIIFIDTNEEYWQTKAEDDGWFYYKDAVDTGEATKPLFSEVAFSGVNMTNEYQGCTVYIDIDAQAVQSANNGASALEAAGWSAGTTESSGAVETEGTAESEE